MKVDLIIFFCCCHSVVLHVRFETLFYLHCTPLVGVKQRLFSSVGFAQVCNSLEQQEGNTVGFCKDCHTSNSTIFITPYAPKSLVSALWEFQALFQ